MYFLYRILSAGAMLLLAPYYTLQAVGVAVNRCETLRERFGILEIPTRAEGTTGGSDAIWIHAVSVGEVLAAKPLIEALKKTILQLFHFCFDDNGNGPASCARAPAKRRWDLLLPSRLGCGRPASSADNSPFARDRDGNGDMAQFPAGGPS